MTTPDPYADESTLGTPTGSTMANGAPAESDEHSLSLSPDGPLLLHDMHLLDTLAHFNRENIPERKPHAKGSGAFGTFECTEDVSRYTKASVLQQGASVRTLARFSTVAGELGSPDTWRDVRGFALRFYTDEGNWDLVGNNTPVFFVKDPMKFPHFIRSQKRLADSGLRDGTMQWDFWTNSPESAHQVTYLMGDRGLPRSWRHMNGYGSHTYMTSNAAGERFWVKFHFHTDQGVENLTNEEAERLAGADSDFHRRDLFEAIERGDHPSWTMYLQAMPYEDAKSYRFNPFDLTKVWPHSDYPLVKVGTFTLNENPVNHFAQIEQATFAPSNIVPGIGFSPDKMLLARVFSYADAHRARVGTNAHQLPVNRPVPEVEERMNHLVWDGHMQLEVKGGPTYIPNSDGRGHSEFQGRVDESWEADGEIVRQAYTPHPEDDHWSQPGRLVREVFDDAQRDRFVETVAGALGDVREDVRERAFVYWTNVDAEIGRRIRERVAAGGGDPIPGAADEEKSEVTEPLPEPAGTRA